MDGKVQKIHPEQVSAKVLEQLKYFAKCRAGKEVKNAVVTVPAYFNHS